MAQSIIIGIDFGTRDTCVAWGKHDADKVPSELIYLADGTSKWGFLAAAESQHQGREPLRDLRLLLYLPQETRSLADPLSLKQIRAALPPNKKPVDVVSDYLKAIKQHTLQILSNNFGTEFWKVIPVKYYLTIPAFWSDSLKVLTFKAANDAGIGLEYDSSLQLISESEAAGLYCLTDVYPGIIKVGDTFVIADCGETTVDLISYEVLQVAPRFRISEVAVGTGGLCGSTSLNRRFAAFVKARLGTKIVDAMIAKGRPYENMMKAFNERLMPTFQDSDNQDDDYEDEMYYCETPGVPDYYSKGVVDGFLMISRTEMLSIFEPIIAEISQLIQGQLDAVTQRNVKQASMVLLLGSFGSHPYLYKRLQEQLNMNPKNDIGIRVVQPMDTWSAVVRGAVICGLQSTCIEIKSRRAGRNYGILNSKTYDAHIHPIECRYWCSYEEKYKTQNIITWLIKQGDEIEETKEISLPFSHIFSPNDTCFIATAVLLGSDSPRSQAEQRSTDPNVYEVCRIDCNLDTVQHHFMTRKNSAGEVYYVVRFNVAIHIHSNQLTFTLQCNGVNYGSATTVRFI
ncbi:hypothetical protein BDZ91DRAFT_846944 [Kalaharituber pfeilii]|nr:hypothetical protein BDZ91DRAFT_846944 [Kalaharituber pfeilii]